MFRGSTKPVLGVLGGLHHQGPREALNIRDLDQSEALGPLKTTKKENQALVFFFFLIETTILHSWNEAKYWVIY